MFFRFAVLVEETGIWGSVLRERSTRGQLGPPPVPLSVNKRFMLVGS